MKSNSVSLNYALPIATLTGGGASPQPLRVKPGKKEKKAGGVRQITKSGVWWLWGAITTGLAVLVFAWWFRERILWDFRLCYCAAWLYRHGENPFANERFFAVSGEEMPFSYPLPTTLFYMPLSWLDWPLATRLWLVVTVVLLGALVLFWWRRFSGDRRHAWFPLLALLSFNLAIPKAVLTGNVVTVESALLWGAFYFLAKGNVPGFVALILPASSFKLTPLLFLVLPLIHPQVRRWKPVVIGAALFGAYLASSYALAPGWFNQYLANVSFNVKEWSQVDVLAPSTYGLSRRLISIFSSSLAGPPSVVFSEALWVTMVVAVLWISWKAARVLAGRGWAEAGLPAILYATLVYALISPRMSDYSYILVIPAALYTAGTLLGPPRSTFLLAALLVPLPFISFHDPGTGKPLEGDFFFGFWSYWSLLMVFITWCVFTRNLIGSNAQGGRGAENALRKREFARATQR